MQKIHTKLTQKYPAYNNWHQTKHHNKIHWGVLVVFTFLVFGMILRWAPISLAADTVPPTIPTNLTVTVVSSSQINLSWTASDDDVGVAGYKIYRCSGSACAPTTQIGTSATNSYSNIGLSLSTTYVYAVSAYDAANNESTKSASASTTTQAPSPYTLNIPLTIKDEVGITRASEPVTSGIPLPESANILNEQTLQIVDSNNNVIPAQFRTLARWKGTPNDTTKSIKWVLVDFQADAPANGSTTYYLKDGRKGNANSTNLQVQDNADDIIVATGKAQFKISKKNFNLFDEVYLDIDKNQVFTVDEKIVSSSKENGPQLIDDDSLNTIYRASNVPPNVITVEENGPLKAVIRVEGFHQSDTGTNGYRYNTRFYFYADKSFVRVRHTFINGKSGGGVSVTYVDGKPVVVGEEITNNVSLDIRLNLDTKKKIFLNAAGTLYQDQLDTQAYIWQKMSAGPSTPLSFEKKNGSNILKTGIKATNAWGTILDNKWGLTIGTQYFWQKFPQRLTFNNSGLVKVELQAEPYDLGNAMGVGDEVIFYFHKADETIQQLRQIAQGFNKDPLFAVAPKEWYSNSRAFYELSPAPASSKYSLYDAFSQTLYQDSINLAESAQLYGLKHYLDFPRLKSEINQTDHNNTVWGNNYWDGIYSQIHQFARTSEYKYLRDLAIPASRHYLETDIWNPDDQTHIFNGFAPAAYQKHRIYNNAMHHYAEGIWYYYYLTGDRRVLDIGEKGAENLSQASTYLGSSISPRTIYQRDSYLLNAYYALGKQKYLDALQVNMERTLTSIQKEGFYPFNLNNEIQYTPNGYYTDQAWMVAGCIADIMYKYYQLIKDERIKNTIIKFSELFDRYHRINQDKASPDYNRFYNQLEIVRNNDGTFTTRPYLRTGSSDDYLYNDGKLMVASVFARAYGLSARADFLTKAEELFNENPYLGSDSKFWGKGGALTTLRTMHLLYYLENPPLDTTPDSTPPQVSITQPSSGSTVSGTITVKATASDNVAVAGVQFKLNGASLGAEDTASPYEVSWDTTQTSNGSHILTAVARDTSGNQATSSAITVTVNNPVDTQSPSDPTNLTTTAISSSQVDLSWTVSTDNIGVTGYKIYRCAGSACAPTTQIATSATNSYSDTGLLASTVYVYAVSAYDGAGNESAKSTSASATTTSTVAPVYLGQGCTTVYYIDKDCDGYGVGVKSSGVYTLGMNDTLGEPGTYTTGDMPDADDDDSTINTTVSWQAKWGNNNAGIINFLQQRKGFTNTSRVFYLSQSGDDSTAVVNDPTHPYRSMVPILTTLHDLQGGAIVIRGGTWSDLNFNPCESGNPCYGLTGSSGHPVYVIAYPGERVETLAPVTNTTIYWPNNNLGYVAYDGIIFKATNYGLGDGVKLHDSDHMTFRNSEFAGWHQLFFGNHTEDLLIEQNVFHDMMYHTVYMGSYGMTSYGPNDFDFDDDAVKYSLGTSPGASYRGKVINNVMYNNGDSGYEPIHINTYIRDAVVEGNIVAYSGGPAVSFQSGVYYSTIKNNVFFDNGRSAIALSLYGPDAQAATLRWNIIENNTIWVGKQTDSIRGTNPSSGIGISDYSTADGHWIKDTTIRNNIIVTDNYNATWGNPTFLFMRNSYPDTNIIENNLIWSSAAGASSADRVMKIANNAYPDGHDAGDYNFAQFQAYSPNFQNNIYADPQFTNASVNFTLTPENFNFYLLSLSPAINAGTVTGAPSTDIRGIARVTPPDIGAYEYGGTPPTAFDQLLNDYNVYSEPSTSKPGYLQPYTDPIFNTQITRITDYATNGVRVHSYAKQNPWNANNSYLILVESINSKWHLYDGQTYQWIKNLDIRWGGKSADPVWHPTDPSIIFYQYGNEFRKIDVTTNQSTTLRTFPSYSYISSMGEGTTITSNGRIALAGLDSSKNVKAIFVYNVFTDQIGSPIDLSGNNGVFDWVGISHSGQYVVTMWGACSGSCGPYDGVKVYRVNSDLSLTYLSNIYNLNKHSDFAVDSDGSDVLVVDDKSSFDHIIKINLSNQTQTEIQTNAGWFNANHISGRCINKPGWAILSTYSASPGDPWIPFRDEIYALKLDGSGEVRRIAHTHSQPYLNNDNTISYWATPRATANKDCTQIMFDSNWRDLSNGGDNVDVYVVDISASVSLPDTTAPSTPTNLTVTAISSSQINLSWTASTDNVGVTGYKIYRCAGLTCAPTVQIATSATNSYSNTGLTVSTAYTYAVSAYDAAGNESAKSSSISATTLASFKPSDLNKDGKVDSLDFEIFKLDFNRTDKPVSDLNQDGIVDTRDLGIMMSEWS